MTRARKWSYRKWSYNNADVCSMNWKLLDIDSKQVDIVVEYYPDFDIKTKLRSVYVNNEKSDIFFIQKEENIKVLIFTYSKDNETIELTRVLAPRNKEEGNMFYKNIMATERKSKKGYTYYTLRG